MSQYETSFAEVTPSIKIVVNDIKNQAVLTDKVNFAHAAWNVQGYLQGLVLGSPVATDQNEIRFSDAELQELGEATQTFLAEAAIPEGASAAPNIVAILSLAKMIYDLLKELGVLDKINP